MNLFPLLFILPLPMPEIPLILSYEENWISLQSTTKEGREQFLPHRPHSYFDQPQGFLYLEKK